MKKSKKAQTALVLGVALWLSGGGVAGATNLYLDAGDNITPANGYPEGARVEKPEGTEKTLSVSGGTWSDWDISGGLGNGYKLMINGVQWGTGDLQFAGGDTTNGAADNNTLTIRNSDIRAAFGGYSHGAAPGSTSFNTLTIQNCTVVKGGTLAGGYVARMDNYWGKANGNTLTIKNSTVECQNIYGGFSSLAVARDNRVEITGGTLNVCHIYGGIINDNSGSDKPLFGNSVRITGATLGVYFDYTKDPPIQTNDIVGVSGRGDNCYNTVSLLGALENGVPTMQFVLGDGQYYDIIAARSYTTDRSHENHDNAVSLAGAIGWVAVNPDNPEKRGELRLHGYYDFGENETYDVSHRDNELHLGGIRIYTKNGTDPETLDYTASVEPAAAFAGYTKTDGQWTRTNAVTTVDTFDKIFLHKVDWSTTVPALQAGSFTYSVYNTSESATTYLDGSKTTLDISDMTLDKALFGTMTLLQSDTANNFDNLKLAYNAATQATPVDLTEDRIVKTETNAEYTENGVTMIGDRIHTVSLADTGKKVNYTIGGKIHSIAFGNVEWKDSGALIDNSMSILSFAGANVDTTNICFTNLQALKINENMTLVKDFGGTVGTITGTKYKVGTTLEGEGRALLSGNDLIFTTETGASREQTHNTVMGAEVGMAALSMGNDFIGTATEGLSLASNVGADGVSSFAQMGGGSMRQETGSHIDSHTWNAILALGHQNKKERGTFEYGAFFEYGTGNYTTHADNDLRGDGSAQYTGGGLLAKWTANHGIYVEGSLRAGSVHDDARNVLSDGFGNPYSYDTNAPYLGGHIGVGKEIPVAGGNTVDVYGKYFYNRRNGVDFTLANGDYYDLDAVTSSVIRLGARYTMKREKWNFYGGVAYEHELDGKATGTADGVAIRGADTSGGSFRGELGATMKPGDNSPWSLDFNVTGFAGKKQGFTGGVSVALMF